MPIPRTSKAVRRAQNIGAAAVALAADDLRGIEAACASIEIQGARYQEGLARMTGRAAPRCGSQA